MAKDEVQQKIAAMAEIIRNMPSNFYDEVEINSNEKISRKKTEKVLKGWGVSEEKILEILSSENDSK